MESLEEVKARIEQAFPGAAPQIVPNPGPAQQPSLLLPNEQAVALARWLRDDPTLQLDYCSNTLEPTFSSETRSVRSASTQRLSLTLTIFGYSALDAGQLNLSVGCVDADYMPGLTVCEYVVVRATDTGPGMDGEKCSLRHQRSSRTPRVVR